MDECKLYLHARTYNKYVMTNFKCMCNVWIFPRREFRSSKFYGKFDWVRKISILKLFFPENFLGKVLLTLLFPPFNVNVHFSSGRRRSDGIFSNFCLNKWVEWELWVSRPTMRKSVIGMRLTDDYFSQASLVSPLLNNNQLFLLYSYCLTTSLLHYEGVKMIAEESHCLSVGAEKEYWNGQRDTSNRKLKQRISDDWNGGLIYATLKATPLEFLFHSLMRLDTSFLYVLCTNQPKESRMKTRLPLLQY